MNEKGLAAGGLYFEDIEYPAVKPGDEVLNITDAVAWVLGNFQNILEVKAALQKIGSSWNRVGKIVPKMLSTWHKYRGKALFLRVKINPIWTLCYSPKQSSLEPL